jgi:hypothetical protein
VAVIFVVPFLFISRKIEEKGKDIEAQKERSRQYLPDQSSSHQPAKARPAPSPAIQMPLFTEMPDRYNYWITFPKKLSNGQVLDKEYVKIQIKPLIKTFSEYHSLSLGEPLRFAVENNGGPSVAVYQGPLKVGYLVHNNSIYMVRDRLEKGDAVFGFFSHISYSKEKIMLKMAYYKDSNTDRGKANFSYEEALEEIEKKTRTVIDYTSKETNEVYLVQKVAMVRNGKHLYYIEKWFSLYIHDQEDASYDFSELKIGAKITAKREPSNSYDPDAVMVKQNGKKIGYLYAETRDMAQDNLKNGGSITGYVTEFNENNGHIHIYVALLLYK